MTENSKILKELVIKKHNIGFDKIDDCNIKFIMPRKKEYYITYTVVYQRWSSDPMVVEYNTEIEYSEYKSAIREDKIRDIMDIL